MDIQLGKTYLNRLGDRITIIEDRGDGFDTPMVTDLIPASSPTPMVCVTREGRYNSEAGAPDNDFDLVSEA